MESITIASRGNARISSARFICQMKREGKPSRRLRMHIILLAADGHSVTGIARALFCSRTTVYSVVHRFLREGQEAFDDRKRRARARTVAGEVGTKADRGAGGSGLAHQAWLAAFALELQRLLALEILSRSEPSW
jgi:Homeodomain-like domain